MAQNVKITSQPTQTQKTSVRVPTQTTTPSMVRSSQITPKLTIASGPNSKPVSNGTTFTHPDHAIVRITSQPTQTQKTSVKIPTQTTNTSMVAKKQTR